MKPNHRKGKYIAAAAGAAFATTIGLLLKPAHTQPTPATTTASSTSENTARPNIPPTPASPASPTQERAHLGTPGQTLASTAPSSATYDPTSGTASRPTSTTQPSPPPSASPATPAEPDNLPPADLIADILAAAGELTDDQTRAETAARIRMIEDLRFNAAVKKALDLGLPISGTTAEGNHFVLRDFENGQPIYDQTTNEKAATTTNTTVVRDNAPYNLTGTGMTAGIWEVGGVPRTSHQELTGRINIGDDSTKATSHGTHVAGTIISAGIVSESKGMAPAATLDAYNTSNALSEMTAAGAATTNDTTKLFISNHSYGNGAVGWAVGSSSSGTRYVWHGTFSNDNNPANDYENNFGRYSSSAASHDSLVASLPHYLPVFASGNTANDGPPSGASWKVAGTNTDFTYNAAFHPPINPRYKQGFDNLEGQKVSKNVLVVGAVNDAAVTISTNIVRDIAYAKIIAFSSRGPTDDGRIKPDIVANGANVYSTESASDTDYSTQSGTSMAAPNVTGSAILLGQLYAKKNGGKLMRASTLKALIIHTADDVGNPGPDYTYGWGLMNTFAAAELIRLEADTGLGADLFQNNLTNTTKTRSVSYTWPANQPIKVTLCWTDPAGATKNSHDNRTPDLVNDLDLTVTGPNGTIYRPYVMPYVGDWTDAKLTANATTGVNKVDNVEQVYIPTHGAGTYTVTVSTTDNLQDDKQIYSLIVSGFTAK